MSGSPVYRKSVPALVFTAIVTAALLLSGPALPAQAEISWKSGVETSARPSHEGASLALSQLSQSGSGRHIVVQFSEPVSLEQRAALETMGVGLLSYLGNNAFFATLKTGGLETTDLQAAPTLTTAMAIEPQWKLAPAILANEYPDYAITMDAETKQPRAAAYVMLHKDVSLDRGHALARAHQAEVVSEIVSINMLVVEMPFKALFDLALKDEVMWIEPPLPFMTGTNDSNSVITQADSAQSAPYNLDGSGIDVLVYDAGYALQSHGDFSGRLTVRDSSTLSDHATHVSGTIGGDGSGNSTYEGMAPAVIIQSYGFEYNGSGTFLYTNPGDLESDYNQAINTYGCDISNNSIGSNVESNYFDCAFQGDYGATAALIDEIVGGSLGSPFRIVWAAGNERGGSRCDVEGYGDYYSTAPPACGKNHITVGALNSNNDSMTYFSSWGPTDDGRLKPDISGPGCQSTGDGGVTSCSSSGGYTTMCGTSMAAPTVTGCLALLLEDFRAQYPAQNDPRNSTLKILLAHNAVDLGNTGPDYQYGYGSIRIADTIDFMRGGEFEENSVNQGGSVVYSVVVPGGTSELKITLAWDDAAGTPSVSPSLVNDLDLVVMSPASVRAYPWTLNPTSPSSAAVRTTADHTNNIEQVLVDNPEAGTWTVTVQGYNVPDGPQTYSICGSPTLGVAGPADCNDNGVPDDEDIAGGTSQDCNGNGVPDECDISYGTSTDCNSNGIPDDCEPGGSDDCNSNGQSDLCDIALGTSEDCNENGIPDDCDIGPTAVTVTFSLDSDPGWATEGLWDYGQPTGDGGQYGGPDPTSGYTGTNVYGYNLSGDYENNLPERHLTTTAIDCSALSGVSLSFRRWLGVERNTYDHAYIRVSDDGSSWTTVWQNPDSATEDSSWSLQTYDISAVADYQSAVYIRWTQGTTDSSWQYCGWNIDDVEISGTTAAGGPGDCNANGVPDECDIADGTSEDCNSNGVPDECDIADGTSEDANDNGIPDECEDADCNDNGIPDDEDIAGGTSQDCDGNGVPDECQDDSDGDGVIDPCDGCPDDPNKTDPGVCGCGTPDTDSDGDGTPDCIDGCPDDPNKIDPGICGCGVPDEDSDGDGYIDCQDNCPATYNPGQEDCDGDGIGDACAGEPDCNDNGIPDSCDIADGTSEDTNDNGIPDECEGSTTVDDEASGDLPVAGTVGGSYTDTWADDEAYEVLTERESGGKPSKRYSYLEHKWSFNVIGGSSITFFFNGYRTDSGEGDDFILSWSTDDSTYTDMFTVDNGSDSGVLQSYILPVSAGGTYYVQAVDADQTSGYRQLDSLHVDQIFFRSETSGSGTPPAAPTGLSAVAVASSAIDISWTDNADDEYGFEIERSPDGVNWTLIDTTGSDVTTYNDTGLDADTTYYYRVRAFNGAGNSGYSNVASATTDQGSGITLSAVGYKERAIKMVDLTWSGAATANVEIWRDGVLLITVTNNGFYTDVLGKTASGTYQYVVCEEGGSTDCSNMASVTF